MKSKSTISKRHCPGEDYEISFSICRGRQKAHYPKCHKCEFKTGVVSTSTTDLSEEQSTGTLRATKSGLAEKTRKKATTGTKPDKDGPKVKRTRKTSKVTKLKKTGSIMVKSKPSSATIVLDGDSIGITPAIIRQIFPGKYEVEVKTDGYDTWKQMVNVVANKETSLNAVLQGKNGSIVVESDPVNARIYVDNDYIGVTPAEICQVVPGTYEVKVMLEGYDIWKKRVSVEANKEESLTAKSQGKNGNLAIESKPTKAKIYINGNYTGDTPVTITDIKPGERSMFIHPLTCSS